MAFRLDSNWGENPVNEIEPVSDGHFATKVPLDADYSGELP